MWRVVEEDNVLSNAQSAAAAAPQEAPMKNGAIPSLAGSDMLDFVKDTLETEKAEDIVAINLRGKSEIADYMVICSGRSTRQVSALADKLADLLKRDHGIATRVEGKEQGDWVLIDAGDVLVHIFRPEVRDFYQLEKMWVTPQEAVATKV